MEMKNLTDEEKFEIEAWYVLRKIKDRFYYPASDSEQEIEYRIYIFQKPLIPSGMPFLIDETKILDWLEKEKKAICRVDSVKGIKGPLVSEWPGDKELKLMITYSVKVSLIKFKDLYEKYQTKGERKMKKLLEQRAYQNRNQIKDELNGLIKIKKIIGKEKRLLILLSNLERKGIKKLSDDLDTKYLKNIKAELKEKLEDTNFTIKMSREYDSDGAESSFYQLEFITNN